MAQLKGFKKLTSIDEALEDFFRALQPKKLSTVLIPVETAIGRVTAKSVTAERNLPPFDRSAVDGYALKAKDTLKATTFIPKPLHLTDKEVVDDRKAKEIWTGGRLPKGADAVMMLEHTRKAENKILALVSLTPGANISKKGEDAKKGQTVMEKGIRLRPDDLGLLAALGMKEVEVIRKPKVAILATGDELIPFGCKSKSDSIVEINSIILSGMCAELGAEAFSLGIAKDDEDDIKEKLQEGLEKADIVITCGGTSVGAYDLVPKVVEQLGHRVIVHGIAMRPGMPTALAVTQSKPLLILSGNPVAAAIGFEAFANPLIRTLLGMKSETRARLKAKLTRRVAGVLGRRVFLRVKVVEKDGEFFVEPIRIKGSSVVTTMTKADGYVIIPEDSEGLRENKDVVVNLFNYRR